MGRPKNHINTIQKTYMLYEEDVKELNLSGKEAKHIFRLGIQAYKKGWNERKDSLEVQNMKQRIKFMSLTLESYCTKLDKLVHIIEQNLNIDVDPEVKNLDKIEEKLKKIQND